MSEPVLRITGLVKNYQGLRPLRLAELSVSAGDQIALLGFDAPAAEMLSTLVTGALAPEAGRVEVLGADTAAFYRDDPNQRTMLEQMASARFTPNHPAWGDMEKAIEDEVEQALYDRKSAAAAVKDAAAKIAALLEKR